MLKVSKYKTKNKFEKSLGNQYHMLNCDANERFENHTWL